MKLAQEIILAPVITEESMMGTADKKYTFKVAKDATKVDIAKAVETLFGVKVEKVTVINMKSKSKRVGYHFGETSEWKKAIVKLTAESKTIEFFDEMM